VKRHIALIGFMAAGKTTIGRNLARSLRCEFEDTDAIVAREHGPVADIFAAQGEPAFREYESAAIERALRAERPKVIALGGGALTNEENRAHVEADAHSIFLKLSPERILTRVQSGARPRPMLGPAPTLEHITSLYEARLAHYERADHIVDTNDLSDRAIVENILAWLHEKQIAFLR
jgi:shikimate kinase